MNSGHFRDVGSAPRSSRGVCPTIPHSAFLPRVPLQGHVRYTDDDSRWGAEAAEGGKGDEELTTSPAL